MTLSHGFKVQDSVEDGRHSRDKARQKGPLGTLPLLRDSAINLRLSESRETGSRGVLGRRRSTTANPCPRQ